MLWENACHIKRNDFVTYLLWEKRIEKYVNKII